ncbi:hypothetical protein FAZ19_04430 [Sphingobacterium alkalisoli]|uniref:Lipocalin-like domain-containing protein n=1 Tax=Sphingobacterium alkalisoli TaxID=1874115 RepID=A0A4U0H9E5_9SPHI|nr:hypothetical protein [Sphingobacterium alkalisoli]TJY68507.1 hypothetical protein FAZ19_04430 [Sphingobacterium alkalisoli]GGH05992.1 hypothetical protein GCM10011418_02490 [Sphingobacterium alkalisoli]
MKMTRFNLNLLFGISVLFLLAGCAKKDPHTEDEDQFNPKFVNSNWGHYSGVLVGSTGYFNILVNGNGVSAVVIFDGQRYEMQSNTPVPEKQQYGVELSKDGVLITFTVDKAGKTPEVNLEIPEHPDVHATIFKSEENMSVKNYMGWSKSTYMQTTHNETYNMTIRGDKYRVVAKSSDESYTETGKIEWVGTDKVRIIAPETTILANVNPNTGVISFKETGEDNYSLEIRLTPQNLLIDDNPDDGDNFASPTPPPGSQEN